MADNKPKAPTVEELMAQVAALSAKLTESENKSKAFGSTFTLNVSDKGCVSVKGPGVRRFGVTLYPSEWLSILAGIGVTDSKLHTFMRENRAKLAWKGESTI